MMCCAVDEEEHMLLVELAAFKESDCVDNCFEDGAMAELASNRIEEHRNYLPQGERFFLARLERSGRSATRGVCDTRAKLFLAADI